MRRLYVLYLLTLTVVVLDIVLFHLGAARAQAPQTTFRVDRIIAAPVGTAPVLGHIVGFDCVRGTDGLIQCFVASKIN